ncbi:MAG TPA: DUF1015 domain-containing protein [Flavobacteriales bacterium]|nr:DUF1015 domain-containing protein [Flavobacteriales bacterium]
MPTIQPIKAIRPVRDKVALVASRAVNTYIPRLLNAKLEENPFTFLQVILPEHGKKATTKPNTVERFKLVKKKFEQFRKEGILIQEKTECIYIYRQIRKGRSYTGLIAGASVSDYTNGIIKVHEQTLKKRQEVFTDYLETCGFNAEPVLLAYKENKTVESVIAAYTKQRPEYEFTTADRISHYLWIIDKPADIKKIQKAFTEIDALYIADGHHRSASSAGLLERKKNKNKKIKGNEMFNYCLSFFLSDSQLRILEFNRLVKDIGKLTYPQILHAIGKNYTVKEIGKKVATPQKPGQMGMYMDGKWYLLTINPDLRKNKNAAQKLDASLLTTYILDPVFNIKDLTKDPRIDFAGGNLGTDYLEKKVNKGEAVIAFYLYPVSFSELKEVSDKNLIMPPKSTYILPKMRSGLIVQPLSQ